MADLRRDAASESRKIHEQLSHPVVDGDGHWLESYPIFLDYLHDVAGTATVDEFLRKEKSRLQLDWYKMAPEERAAGRVARPSQWTFSADALDRATVSLPGLLSERLDAFGIDYAIVYPTMGLRFGSAEPAGDLRRAMCRAYNKMSAEMFSSYSDRMTPVAVLPSLTPEEAMDEADYAVHELGLKAAVIMGTIPRPIPAFADTEQPPTFIDNLVLDPIYDYDPLWEKFIDLKLAVTTHSGSLSWSDRRSPSNFCYDHIGHFAQANHTFARGLFFSGVTYRFPNLKFAFLEGGVGWAIGLLADLISHWHVRSPEALAKMNPSNLDTPTLQSLYEEYGGRWLSQRTEVQLDYLDLNYPGMDIGATASKGRNDTNDFAAAHVSSAADVSDRFRHNFYFGCEADDPMTALAFDSRLSEGLKPILGSDIGHFDVPDLTKVLSEAHELVEKNSLTEHEFKEFSFGNIVQLHGTMNPHFFEGTAVGTAARDYLLEVTTGT